MAKFEITNPEAIKLIEDFKSGAFFKPYLDKIKKVKWIIISVSIFILFLIFVIIGKTLYRSSETPVFLPPDLSNPEVSTVPAQTSEYDALKSEIFNYSTDLPDPVNPDLNNKINLKKEEE